MAKITISWRNYPGCPEATEYDKSRSYLASFIGIFVNLILLCCAIGFFVSIGDYWSNENWGQFFVANLCLIGGGVLAYLMYVLYPHFTERGLQLILLNHRSSDKFSGLKAQEEKLIKEKARKELAHITKMYYFWYLSIVIFIAIGSLLIFSIVQLVNGNDGALLLFFSICLGVGSVFGFKYLKKHIEKDKDAKTNNNSGIKKESNEISNSSKTSNEISCKKCGKKLSILQATCPVCNTPVSQNSELKVLSKPKEEPTERFCATPFIQSVSREYQNAKKILDSNPSPIQSKQALDTILRIVEDDWCFESGAFVIAGEYYESIKNYDKALECYNKALKRGEASVKERVEKLIKLKNNTNSSTLSPKDFYKCCIEAYHKFANEQGLAKKGLIFIPELIEYGNNSVLAYLQDKFFSIEYANDPATYYFVINSFAFQTGIVYAAIWHTNFSQLKDGKWKDVISNGAWDYVEELLLDLELDKEEFNKFQSELYKEWISLHEPYWELEDPRKYTFNALLASYQLGISIMLDKYGY